MSIIKKHARNKDQFLDKGGANQSTALDVKSAVDLKHTQNTDTILTTDGTIQLINAGTLKINLLADDGVNIQIDEIRARDADGLKLFDDAGNGILVQDGGNVKIGNVAETALTTLHILDSSPTIRLSTGGTGNTGGFEISLGTVVDFKGLGSNDFLFSTNNSERMRIEAGGNIGINVTPTLGKLHVKQTQSDLDGGITIQDPGGGTGRFYHTISNNVVIQKGTNTDQIVLENNGDVKFEGRNVGINVGAGAVDAPHVVVGDDWEELKFYKTGSTTFGRLHSTGSNILRFSNNLSFDGTDFNLDDISEDGVTMLVNATAGSSGIFAVEYASAGANPRTTSVYFRVKSSGVIQFDTYGAGTLITDASGNISVSSDERLKNIQSNFVEGLNEILQLNPINYRWNEKSGLETETLYSGLTAQDVQKVIPSAVNAGNDGYLSLSDRPIISALVNAIKELNSKIKILESQIN